MGLVSVAGSTGQQPFSLLWGVCEAVLQYVCVVENFAKLIMDTILQIVYVCLNSISFHLNHAKQVILMSPTPFHTHLYIHYILVKEGKCFLECADTFEVLQLCRRVLDLLNFHVLNTVCALSCVPAHFAHRAICIQRGCL